VSGNFWSEFVATLNPFFQQFRVDGPFVQEESRSWSSAGMARDVAANANRHAPIEREKNIMDALWKDDREEK